MKHNVKITAILLVMFLIAQFIGLYVVNQYLPEKQTIYNNQTGEVEIVQNYSEGNKLPYGFQPDENDKPGIFSIIISFVLAVSLILFIMKYKWKFLIRIFFFFVITFALAISINALLKNWVLSSAIIAIVLAVILSFLKIFKPHYILHNFTELLIYPGIAPMFVVLFNWKTVIIMLILISIYDMWAVWHSGIMQKMAKFQVEEVGIFGGFFIPYLTKKVRAQIALLKKSKSKKNKKLKISLAMLGGGDIIFPIITAGVFLREFDIFASMAIIFGAFLGLLFLFMISQKKKFYPAMPFITAGIFLGLLVWKIASFI